MKKQLTKKIALCLLALSVWNCKTSDPEPTPYDAGVYIINQGNYFDNNGSLSFVAKNSTTTSTNIFNTVNARPLTGGVQDYSEIDGKGVILVDNSTAGQDKVEIVEAGTLKSLGTIQAPDVENPRYVVKAGLNKAYISCWAATGSSPFYVNPGYILVIDLASRTVKKKIPVAKGAERIVVVGNEAFVGNVGGERILAVINTDTDELEQSGLDVGVNPRPIAVDFNGKLWAYTSSTKEMVKINPVSKAIETRLVVGSSTKSPASIAISADKKTFYFVNSYYDANYNEKGETYQFSIDATSIPATTPFINRFFTGLGVDPQTGLIYGGVTPSYKQAGYVLRYKPNGTSSTLVDSVKAEIAPSGFYFR